MVDGPVHKALKALVLATWTVELRLRRGPRQIIRAPRYRLGGACASCAKCCERPAIQVDRLTWYVPVLRRAFLGWQRKLNGFELVGGDRETRTFSFRCTHFDLETRRCDSYGSRPGLCRDYPRALLAQPWPEFFEECGYRPVVHNAEGMAAALAETALSAQDQEALRRRLKLE